MDFKKIKTLDKPVFFKSKKEDSLTGHTKQHPLGNSDLKTSSDESSHRVCRTAPPTSAEHLLWGPCASISQQASPGVDSVGEGTWPLLSFRLAGNRLRPLAGSLHSKSLPPTWYTRGLLVPSCRPGVACCNPSLSNA